MFHDYCEVTGRDWATDADCCDDVHYTGTGGPPDPLFYFTNVTSFNWLTLLEVVGKATKVAINFKDASRIMYIPTALIKEKSGNKYIHTNFLRKKLTELKGIK